MSWFSDLFQSNKGPPPAGVNPQFYSGAKKVTSQPALIPGLKGTYDSDTPIADAAYRPVRMPEIITSGFFEDELHTFHLSYGFREQPDVGGALNYAYENYGLPLNDVCGAFMVARFPIPPIGSRPLGFYQIAPETSIGGLIPGQIISQPLLNPNDLGSGFDIYD